MVGSPRRLLTSETDIVHRSPLSSSWLNYLKPRVSDYGSALFIVRNRTLADNAVGENAVLAITIFHSHPTLPHVRDSVLRCRIYE
jgi:hypothetical protein